MLDSIYVCEPIIGKWSRFSTGGPPQIINFKFNIQKEPDIIVVSHVGQWFEKSKEIEKKKTLVVQA